MVDQVETSEAAPIVVEGLVKRKSRRLRLSGAGGMSAGGGEESPFVRWGWLQVLEIATGTG
ncbi:MAG: hypothetical protein O2931_00490 [Planctomycetota bacterium]|nr:hypothetical protein [Planctomycetota bacterium]MDA1177251.1 hypothetical protein [Planctomycetota bacterium]